MELRLSDEELLARLRADMRAGLPIRLIFGQEALCVSAAEAISERRFSAMPVPQLLLTHRRAAQLNIPSYTAGFARISLPAGLGISSLRTLIDPAFDIDAPPQGPFENCRDARLPQQAAEALIGLIKSSRLLPAALIEPGQKESWMTEVSVSELVRLLNLPLVMQEIAAAPVPLSRAKISRVHVFRAIDGRDEHYAIEIGLADRSTPVLTRLHSACFTGDVLGSLKCDCGPQLHRAIEMMEAEGSGMLLYLNQEGRGIGLANKMRAYQLQHQGLDTVEANHRLGFEDDERDFDLGARMLKALGFTQIRLLTNNPNKVDRLGNSGITVTRRVPLKVGRTALNAAYLNTKAQKSGHLL